MVVALTAVSSRGSVPSLAKVFIGDARSDVGQSLTVVAELDLE